MNDVVAGLGIDLNQTVQEGTLTMVSASGVLMLSVLIVLMIVIKKRWEGRLLPFFMGMLVYIAFGWLFTNTVMNLLILVPSIDANFENNHVSYLIIYYIVMAIGVTIARVVSGFIMKDKFERRGDIYLNGLGVAAGECFFVGLTIMEMSIWSNVVAQSGLAGVLAQLNSAEEMMTAYNSMQQIFVAPSMYWIVLGLNACVDMFLSIALTVLIFQTVKGRFASLWYTLAAVFQFVATIPFQLHDYSSLNNIMLTFGIKLAISIAVIGYIFRFVVKEIKYSND